MSLLYKIARPLFFAFDAETAHGLAIKALQYGLVPSLPPLKDPVLETTLWGLRFPTPVGLAAGFDKNGLVPDALLNAGFGFVEVGTVTPRPQPGNPKPRMFRLVEDRAVINRLGFNNDGLDVMASRLRARGRKGILGANVGANKDSADPVEDYVKGIKTLSGLADYFTVNISSPNTPGLRGLQRREPLARLLKAVLAARVDNTPILVKIAPDLTLEEREDIAALALEHKVDGLIVSNTTISRPAGLKSKLATETGGLSGAPLRNLARDVIHDIYRLTSGQIPLIGAGGIANGADAYARIRAGASLVQLYSAMVYEGPHLADRVARELSGLLQRDGFTNVAQAVGADHQR